MSELATKSDSTLVELILIGDQSAFNELYERYWEVIYDIAYKKLRNEEDAKDLTHDLFVNLWVKREKLLIYESMMGYLYVSLRNLIVDKFRKESRIRKRREATFINEKDFDNTTFETIISKDLNDFISTEVAKMPTKMQEVYRLSREENLSIDSIAEHLSISPQTVKNQIGNALRRLKSKLPLVVLLIILIWDNN